MGYAKLEVEVGCKLCGRWLHGLQVVENWNWELGGFWSSTILIVEKLELGAWRLLELNYITIGYR